MNLEAIKIEDFWFKYMSISLDCTLPSLFSIVSCSQSTSTCSSPDRRWSSSDAAHLKRTPGNIRRSWNANYSSNTALNNRRSEDDASKLLPATHQTFTRSSAERLNARNELQATGPGPGLGLWGSRLCNRARVPVNSKLGRELRER